MLADILAYARVAFTDAERAELDARLAERTTDEPEDET